MIVMALAEIARALVGEGEERGIELRILGSVAVGLLTGSDLSLRPAEVKDIDLATTGKLRTSVRQFLQERGWRLCSDLLLYSENRDIYFSPSLECSADLYYDEIDGNHKISIKKRLHLSFPTLSPIDLLLSKLQRVHLRPQDVWDVCALLSMSYDEASLTYFSQLLGKNWGLYTTIMDNLGALSTVCSSGQVAALLDRCLREPKTFSWKVRSLVGRKKKWWDDVYEAQLVLGEGGKG